MADDRRPKPPGSGPHQDGRSSYHGRTVADALSWKETVPVILQMRRSFGTCQILWSGPLGIGVFRVRIIAWVGTGDVRTTMNMAS